MKCPLLAMAEMWGEPEKKPKYSDCLKEECGFWDPETMKCSEVTKTRELSIIRSLLKDIRDKMPHEEQF